MNNPDFQDWIEDIKKGNNDDPHIRFLSCNTGKRKGKRKRNKMKNLAERLADEIRNRTGLGKDEIVIVAPTDKIVIVSGENGEQIWRVDNNGTFNAY